jgi:hypothetical protein
MSAREFPLRGLLGQPHGFWVWGCTYRPRAVTMLVLSTERAYSEGRR